LITPCKKQAQTNKTTIVKRHLKLGKRPGVPEGLSFCYISHLTLMKAKITVFKTIVDYSSLVET
jgi:hypothetical protein